MTVPWVFSGKAYDRGLSSDSLLNPRAYIETIDVIPARTGAMYKLSCIIHTEVIEKGPWHEFITTILRKERLNYN